MASPITTLGAATIGPAVSVTTPGTETVMTGQLQPAQQTQPAATAASAAPQQQQQSDTVDLSPRALDLSKELTDKKEKEQKQPALDDQDLKRKFAEPVIRKPTDKTELSIAKSYPPFLGNTDELKQLRQVSPALYLQLLRMIVPPPVNISYSDAQLLQRPTIDAKS